MSQGVHLRKYGVQTTIEFELYEVNGVDLRTNWTPAQSDCEIDKNGGGYTQCSNTASGTTTYRIVLTATEVEFARGMLKIVDAATKAFLDKVVIIETYGHASAQHAFDLGTASITPPVVIPAGYIGDYRLGETLHFVFSTTETLTPGTVSVYKEDGSSAISPGLVTLDNNFQTNVHQVSIVLADTSYDPDADYEVVLMAATVGGNTVTAAIATFSIQNRYQEPVHRQNAK